MTANIPLQKAEGGRWTFLETIHLDGKSALETLFTIFAIKGMQTRHKKEEDLYGLDGDYNQNNKTRQGRACL